VHSQKEITMQKLVWLCGFGVLGACATAPVDSGEAPAEPATGVVTANSFAYRPMGFARITAAGGVLTAFDSLSASPTPVSVTHSPGAYAVTFASLAAPSPLTDATGGNVQVTAEGTNNTRCRIINWGGTPNLTVNVQCNLTDGTLADSPFAVLFYRNDMPASGGRATAAYSWVTATGTIPSQWDYSDSGVHNTVTKTTGQYQLTLKNALPINASMAVTPYGGSAPGAACSIVNWFASGIDILVNIECRNTANQLADSAFSFSYASTGPTFDQQGAHAWFNGSIASPSYSDALGKVISCSPASVTGSASSGVVTMTVSGDLGPWDASPFLRASLSSKYGTAGYCKVESLTVTGAPPSTNADTKIHCYDATGASVASPRLTFTHVTSDAAGPC
jgi:hypothetical protein